MKAREVLELLESPPRETDIDKHLSACSYAWYANELAIELSPGRESTLLFNIYLLEHDQAEYCAMSCIGFWDVYT